MDYVTVYNVANASTEDWSFFEFGIGCTIVALAVLMFDRMGGASRFKQVYDGLFIGVGLVLTGLGYFYHGSAALSVQAMERDGKYRVVEGRIENFHAMPYAGHAMETFDVNGVHFSYSDYVITGGFNRTRSHGGPLYANRNVRLAYISRKVDGNVIVRIEVTRGS